MTEDFTAYLQGYDKGVQRSYIRSVQQFLSWLGPLNLKPGELRLKHFQGFISHLQEEGIRLHQLNHTLSALRHFGYMLVQQGKANEQLAVELYIQGIHKNSFPSILAWSELEQAYNTVKLSGFTAIRDKAILGMVIYQALTTNDLGNLCVRHLNLAAGKVSVPKTFFGNSRVLKLEKHQVDDLQTYLSETRPVLLAVAEKESERLFMSLGGSEHFGYITDKMIIKLRKQFPHIASYPQMRASTLYHWYEKYGLKRTIQLAGYSYIKPSNHAQ